MVQNAGHSRLHQSACLTVQISWRKDKNKYILNIISHDEFMTHSNCLPQQCYLADIKYLAYRAVLFISPFHHDVGHNRDHISSKALSRHCTEMRALKLLKVHCCMQSLVWIVILGHPQRPMVICSIGFFVMPAAWGPLKFTGFSTWRNFIFIANRSGTYPDFSQMSGTRYMI